MIDFDSLDELCPGQRAEILRISGKEETALRLMELGFAPGDMVEALYRGPFGGPTAYGVRGTVVALRRGDARRISVRRCEQQDF